MGQKLMQQFQEETNKGKWGKNCGFSQKPENHKWMITQPAITCSKLTIETLEQSVKYVQSWQ